MSNLLEISKPIPIKYTKSKFSFNDPPTNDSSYLFNLTLKLKNKKTKNFIKIEKNKYSNIIELEDNIDYDSIINYKIEITKIPLEKDTHFFIEEDFNHDLNSNSKKSDDIYIEFTKNNSNKTICNCYFLRVDFNSIFISPPN